MNIPGKRRFNLLDAITLVALTAIGCAWCITTQISLARRLESGDWSGTDVEHEFLSSADSFRHWVATRLLVVGISSCRWLSLFLIVGTFAFFLLRYRQPRLSFRELVRSPGTAACVAGLMSVTVQLFRGLLVWSVCMLYPAGDDITGPTLFDITKDVSITAGHAVLASWLILRLSRTVRHHGDWVEFFGVILGFGWILLLLEPVLSVALMLVELINGGWK
jgi:hypothetical protein